MGKIIILKYLQFLKIHYYHSQYNHYHYMCDFSCKTRSTRLVSKDRESSSVRFCGRLCLFLFVGHCEKRNWGKDKFSASLVENVSILFACSMTCPLVQATIFACSASNKNASVLLVYPKKSPNSCFP